MPGGARAENGRRTGGSRLLLRLAGFPALLTFGDPLVLDRWLWLRRRLKRLKPEGLSLMDAGCGSGVFTIGAALMGFDAVGFDHNPGFIATAAERARLLGATARFETGDLRKLGGRDDLKGRFDVVTCCENIEHVIDDAGLLANLAACMRPGGRLLLTAPNIHYRPITDADAGPFLPVEDGSHVRRGYDSRRLSELCAGAGLTVRRIGYLSGFFSQKLALVRRILNRLGRPFSWVVILPIRIVPPIFDPVVRRFTSWPDYSIRLEAVRDYDETMGGRR